MAVIASDGKEFKRPKIIRDDTGQIQDIQVDKGFFTPFGVTLWFDKPEKFKEDFTQVFKKMLPKYNVSMGRNFGSAYFMVYNIFRKDFRKSLSFLYSILDEVQDHISKAHINWVILPDAVDKVSVGGLHSVVKEIKVNKFKRDMGNIFPAVCAWSYTKQYGEDYDIAYIDNFQGKTTNAWSELLHRAPELYVVPKGDECNPFICMADIFAFLTDRRLFKERKKLFPKTIEEIWKDYPFKISTFYFRESNLGNIKWLDEKLIDVRENYPSPMVYLLVDKEYMGVFEEEEPITMKDFLTTRGFHEVPLLFAQIVDGGAKGFHPNIDSSTIKDGDYLIYMGEDSEKTAKRYSYALDITTMSVKECRRKIKEKGYDI